MNSTTQIVLTILIALILCASVYSDDGVELPVEYYLGRWTPGHNFDGIMRWQKGNDTKDVGSYFYQHGKYRVGLNNIKEYFLFETASDPDTFRTADFSFQYRPVRNWQIGVDQLSFYRFDDEWHYRGRYISDFEDQEDLLEAGVSSVWSNNLTSHLNSSAARFAYLGSSVFGRGHVVMTNSFSFTRWGDYSKSLRIDSTGSRESSDSYSTDVWTIRSNVNWGLSDAVSLSAGSDLRVVAFDHTSDYRRVTIDSTWSPTRSLTERNDYYSTYCMEILYRPVQQLMVSSRIDQRFSKSMFKRSSQRDNQITVDAEGSSPLQENRTDVSVSADWLSLGDFDSRVLLDDYNGFYRQMLFHRQLHIHTTINRRSQGDASRPNIELISWSQRIAYGLYNHFEFSVDATYGRWKGRAEDGYEYLDARLSAKYRSYSYNPESGPGWYRDNPADVVFGPVLELGQVYLTMEYVRPQHMSQSTTPAPGFLAYSNLVSSHHKRLTSSAEAGLGNKTQLAFKSDVLIYYAQLLLHFYDLEITKRMYEKVEFSFGVSAEYHKHPNNGPPATVRVRLRTII